MCDKLLNPFVKPLEFLEDEVGLAPDHVAVRILGASDDELLERMREYQTDLNAAARAKGATVRDA